MANNLKKLIINNSINTLKLEKEYKGIILFNDVFKIQEILLKEEVLV